MKTIWDFYSRLVAFEKKSQDHPTRLKLLNEIYNAFLGYYELPDIINLSFKNHYSHRLLKETFLHLGYRVQAKPDCSDFKIKRVKPK